jgi:hypothetical protein
LGDRTALGAFTALAVARADAAVTAADFAAPGRAPALDREAGRGAVFLDSFCLVGMDPVWSRAA